MGVSFILSERYTIGGVLLLLSVLRASHAARQLADAFGRDEDES